MARAIIITRGLLLAALAGIGPAAADSIGEVENARAKERAGRYLSEQDVEKLKRWGGESRWRRGYGYYDGPPYGWYSYAPPARRRYHGRW